MRKYYQKQIEKDPHWFASTMLFTVGCPCWIKSHKESGYQFQPEAYTLLINLGLDVYTFDFIKFAGSRLDIPDFQGRFL